MNAKNKTKNIVLTAFVAFLVGGLAILSTCMDGAEKTSKDDEVVCEDMVFEETALLSPSFSEDSVEAVPMPMQDNREEIAAIISEAEALVADEDLENAMAVITQGVLQYPNSPELMVKQAEISTLISESARDEILQSASELVELGDYTSAILLIKNAQQSQNYAEYDVALEEYEPVYLENKIAEADLAADRGDYVASIRIVGEASALLGDREELDTKSIEYVGYYLYDINRECEKLLSEGDFDNAKQLVDNAHSIIGDNEQLDALMSKIDYLRPVEGDEIVKLLEKNVISQSGTTAFYWGGSKRINAFAEDHYDAISINTGAWYNMWGNGVQTVDFRVADFPCQKLTFTVCGETGSSGSGLISIFFDRPIDDSEPDICLPIQDVQFPVSGVVDLTGHSTMSLKVSNGAGHENRYVLYDFKGYNSL